MSRREEYENIVKAKLRELEAEVERLKVKIVATEAELSPEHKQKFERVQQMWNETKEKADELLKASDDKFEGLQTGLQHYYTAIGNELKAYEKQ